MRLLSTLACVGALTLGGGCIFDVDAGASGGPSPFDTQPFFETIVVDRNDPLGSLDGLFEVEGSLVVRNLEISVLSNFELSSVGGDLILLDNPGLSSLSFRNLASVGGRIRVENNAVLQNLTLDALVEAQSGINVVNNPALSLLDFDFLFTAGEIAIDGPELNDVNLPQLVSTTGNVLIGNPAFEANQSAASLLLPRLEEIDGDFFVANNMRLRTMTASRLETVAGDLIITSNPLLSSIDLEDLSSVDGRLCVCRNPVLDGCLAKDIRDQASLSEANADIDDNRTICAN